MEITPKNISLQKNFFMSVRVRFAPSPTGPLHIGGVRTALFNYLFAKKNNGIFYLRIEDTDRNRYVEGAEEYILEALEWLGIPPDETVGKYERFGPYRQSERKAIYKDYAMQLVESGWAYYAFDTPESLENHRKDHEAQGKTFIYNWHNREKLDTSLVMTEEELAQRLAQQIPYVIRFKTPVNEIVEVKDIIRGDVKFDSNLLDDKVLFKSDGMPTYHLANIVDDHLMETTHVIRGEEWLPSLALHVLLYRAFGWKAPEFAHLPLILKPIGNGKLSKRDGDKYGFPVFPLEWKTTESVSMGYREQGYFPEAVVNFLALLGWNDGTNQEIFSLEELVEKFDLNRIHKAGAKFDPEKNKWFNQQYLQTKQPLDLLVSLNDVLSKHTLERTYSDDKLLKVIELLKERAVFVEDFWDLGHYFFVAPISYDEKIIKKFNEETIMILNEFIKLYESLTYDGSVELENLIKSWLQENNFGIGKLMQPLRVSLVGALQGPHLFDIIDLLGKEETIRRIQKFVQNI